MAGRRSPAVREGRGRRVARGLARTAGIERVSGGPPGLTGDGSGRFAVPSIGARTHPSAGTIRSVHARLVPVRRAVVRRLPVGRARLHALAFAGGVLILLLGITGWATHGGPSSLQDVVIVLDLTVGGTLLITGALVGRARAQEARRSAQLQVLQHAARRMSSSLTAKDVGRAVVEETRRVVDYHNARVYL